jgi:hypothetical protein
MISYAWERSPKKGFDIADFISSPAEFRTAKSTLSRGRNKNLSSSILSNPHSSRNSMPPLNLPTLLCHHTRGKLLEKYKQGVLIMVVKLDSA